MTLVHPDRHVRHNCSKLLALIAKLTTEVVGYDVQMEFKNDPLPKQMIYLQMLERVQSNDSLIVTDAIG